MPAVELIDVSKTIDGTAILRSIDWTIGSDEHWVVIGPNGGGKSTLVRIAGLAMHPTTGIVRVLGAQLGAVDIRSLRSEVGLSSAGLIDQLRGSLTAEEVVRCGRFGALEPWWHTYTAEDSARARRLLAEVGLAGFDDHPFNTLSSGERQRTLLARTLMNDPSLVLLDEPTAGLDFVGREQLITSLDELAASPRGPATVLVTHHLEDIPGSTTHLLAIGEGSIVASGPIDDVLDDDLLARLFGLPVMLERHGQRWSARAAS